MKFVSKRLWICAIIGVVASFGNLHTASAAPPGKNTANREQFRALLSSRSTTNKNQTGSVSSPAQVSSANKGRVRARAGNPITDPFSKAGIDAFNRRLVRQGRTPPPVPGVLPISDDVIAFRRSYILRSIRRGHSGIKGSQAGFSSRPQPELLTFQCPRSIFSTISPFIACSDIRLYGRLSGLAVPQTFLFSAFLERLK